MSRQSYIYQVPTRSRNTTAHRTSSAFSKLAKPDEDWTKISDLAERRKIQWRIAQRKRRSKLNRRLEEVGRREGSSSAAPPQQHAELHHPEHHEQQWSKRSLDILHRQTSPSTRILQTQYTQPLHHGDDLMFGHGFEREGLRTPPLFGYQHIYPSPEDMSYLLYPQPQLYRSVPTGAESGEYIEPVTFPSLMHFPESINGESEDAIVPFNLSYQGLLAIDIQESHKYDDPSTTHTTLIPYTYDHQRLVPTMDINT